MCWRWAAPRRRGLRRSLVIFDRTLAPRIDNRLKQAGQVGSKTRFMTAALLGLLESGAWEGHAAHANLMAKRVEAAIRARTPFALAHPVEANLVFVRMPAEAHARLLDLGWGCYDFSDGSIRFACSWATTTESVDELPTPFRKLLRLLERAGGGKPLHTFLSPLGEPKPRLDRWETHGADSKTR